MVSDIAQEFIYVLPKEAHNNVLCGCWVHDIIEDARETYNDVKKATNETIAELAYALTNEKGKSRQERANDKYYEGIRNTSYASFIKMCDRIANYRYAKQNDSRMITVYEKEHKQFISKIYKPEIDKLIEAIEKEMKNTDI